MSSLIVRFKNYDFMKIFYKRVNFLFKIYHNKFNYLISLKPFTPKKIALNLMNQFGKKYKYREYKLRWTS